MKGLIDTPIRIFFGFAPVADTYSDGDIIIDQDEGGVDASEFSFGRHILVCFYLIIGASCQKLNSFS